MDQRKDLQRLSDLVPLQMAYQLPFEPQVSARSLPFRDGLLKPVLTDYLQAGRRSCMQSIERVSFGHPDYRNVCIRAAASLATPSDAFAHLGQRTFKSLKIHNQANLRGTM
jgi:hypothetical protein